MKKQKTKKYSRRERARMMQKHRWSLNRGQRKPRKENHEDRKTTAASRGTN